MKKIIDNFQPLDPEEINKIEEFRKSKKTAVLAILFTDIVGSTDAAEKLGESSYGRIRHIHDELFTRIMTHDDAGIIIKEIGDSFLCVFAEPSTAVSRAIEFQDALAANRENLTSGAYTLTARVGIHLGQVSVEEHLSPDIFGSQVNKAARVMSLALGGQVLVTHAIWENAIGWLTEQSNKSVRAKHFGKIKLKGIQEQVHIYEMFNTNGGSAGVPHAFKRQRNHYQWAIGFALLITLTIVYLLATHTFRVKEQSSNENVPDSLFYAGARSGMVDTSIAFPWIRFYVKDSAFYRHKLSSVPESVLTRVNEESVTAMASTMYPQFILLDHKDIERLYSAKGKLCPPIIPEHDWSEVGCRSNFFLYVYSIIPPYKGKKYIGFMMARFAVKNTSSSMVNFSWFKDPVEISSFINRECSDYLETYRKSSVTGHVVDCENGKLLFRISPDSHLQKGMVVNLFRIYAPYMTKDDSGVVRHARDIEKGAYYCALHKECLKKWMDADDGYDWTYHQLKDLRSKGPTFRAEGGSQEFLYISAKILDVHDTTAIGVVIDRKFPWVEPKAGDEISLK